MQHASRPCKGLLQFRLRGLLVLVAVLAAASWLAHQKQHERAIVAQLNELGCDVLYNYEFDPGGNFEPDPHAPGPAWLRALVGDDLWATPRAVLVPSVLLGLPDERARQITQERIELLKQLPTLKDVWVEEGLGEYQRALPCVRAGRLESGGMF